MKQEHKIISVFLQIAISECRTGRENVSYASRDGCRKSRHHLCVVKSVCKIGGFFSN